MIRLLLIEDDRTTREDLRELLLAHSDVSVVGEAATFLAAKKLLQTDGYDLVFLDIGLIGGSGLDLVPFVRVHARVIFVTGADFHAVRAFALNALDYLVKPVAVPRLAESLARFRQLRPNAPAGGVRPAKLGRDDVIPLKAGGDMRLTPIATISMITAEENYTRVRLVEGREILVRRGLKEWAEILPSTHFLRVHRQVIVNLACVMCYRSEGVRAIVLQLRGVAEPVPVSLRFTSAVKTRIAAQFS